ncbi:Putative FAD-binding domain, FAD/NAD(P)-binding domain superfamily [Septoria linicola]|uniref:FAD-binding domain, FAD/NAD(P)-binding domain superfamily n=1 Tax=Septoria linicola TaxID=215465 RepID=A0A9Q9EMK1_9PEZI|nr:Putative FAD-binding domain, FAD/NAD(P)-binding domain superfamily [Septoria linicola]
MSPETEKLLHPLSEKHIIISGAGIAGLAFARGLDRQWPLSLPPPKVTLYERDDRHLPAERGNYSLGLRSDKVSGGIQAIRELGMLDEIIKASVPGSDSGGSIRDHNWEPLVPFKLPETPPDGLPVSNMRITRNSIRETFIQGLPSSVQANWGTQCTSASKSQNGGMTVSMSDGTFAHCDLLVVADGASSKLRSSLRPLDTLQYAGAVCIGGNAFFERGKVPAHVSGSFGVVVGGNGIGLVVFPIDDRSAVWFLTQRSKEPRTAVQGAAALKMKDEILEEVISKGDVFGKNFKQILDATDPTSLKIFNAQDKRPITHTEAEVEEMPVVFIGDSNHAVSPFAGNGANMALMDGVSLSKALCEEDSIARAVAVFDKESNPRCTKAWRISHVVIRIFHAQGIFLWFILAVLKTLFWFLSR